MRFILLLSVFFLSAVPACRAQNPLEQTNQVMDPKQLSDLNKTAADLQEEIKQHPEKAELHIRLGFTWAKLGKVGEARRSFENAVKLDPKKAIAHYMLGLIYEKQGLKAEAVAAWKACLESADGPRLRETALKHLHHLETTR